MTRPCRRTFSTPTRTAGRTRITRRGVALRRLIPVLIVVAAIPAALWLTVYAFSSGTENGPILWTAQRGDFVHDITESGNIESGNNVEIRCEVEAKGGGGTTIISILPEGTSVKGPYVKNRREVIPARDGETTGPALSSTKFPAPYENAKPVAVDDLPATVMAAVKDADDKQYLEPSEIGQPDEDSGKQIVYKIENPSGPTVYRWQLDDPHREFFVTAGGRKVHVTRAISEAELPRAVRELAREDDPRAILSGIRQVAEKSPGDETLVYFLTVNDQVELEIPAGEIVVELDSSALEQSMINQQITCNTSSANVIQAQNDYDTAVIAKQEYLEGTYVVEKQGIDHEIIVAKEDLSRAEDYLMHSKKLYAKGYVTRIQLDADEFAVQQAQNSLDKANTKLVALEEFTKRKTVSQLDADIKTAEAQLQAQLATHNLDLEQLELARAQIKKCTIRTPEDGQIVYANVSKRHGGDIVIDEGEAVRENQVIVRLPDPTQMQVDVKISEAKVTLVDEGMRATIQLDAFPNLELHGRVEMVNELPEPTGWFSTGAKEYKTIVQVENPPEGLRPGLTAKVQIHVEHLTDVLQLPAQAVFEHGGKYYCVRMDHGRPVAQELEIGSTNDDFIVIHKGIQAGDKVVLQAAAYRDKVDLPEIAEVDNPNGTAGPPSAKPGGDPSAKPADKQNAAKNPPAKKPPAAKKPAAKKPTGDPFARFDKNGDGQLEQSEVPGGFWSKLKAADSDKSGTISRAEMNAAIAKMRAAGGGAHGGGPPGGRP